MEQSKNNFDQLVSSGKQFWSKATPQQKVAQLVVLFLVIVLPVSLYVSSQSAENRQQAAGTISTPISIPDICPTPPTCNPNETLVYGDPMPGSNSCPAYQCMPIAIDPTLTLTPTTTPTIVCIGHASGKRADFNDSGIVDLNDYVILVHEFLQTLPSYRADANCDGRVDLNDYVILVHEFLR